MASVSTLIDAAPERVFAVLSDGWAYTNWVVGTSHMRAVDGDWPAAGSKLHHAVGVWPMLTKDETEVVSVVPGRALTLTARARPLGQARVVLELRAEGTGTRLTMDETLLSGPGRWLHNPLFEAALVRRNSESLARLRAIAERRTRPNG